MITSSHQGLTVKFNFAVKFHFNVRYSKIPPSIQNMLETQRFGYVLSDHLQVFIILADMAYLIHVDAGINFPSVIPFLVPTKSDNINFIILSRVRTHGH